ncbi:transposase [Streptomyces arenae]|nr:transposase [Streptomyces arenae]
MSDERRQLIEPVLTAWRAERRGRGLDIGRPPEHDLRPLMNAILYVDRAGVPWRYLPHDFPPWSTTYHYFACWQEDGVFTQLTGPLRHLVRAAEGRDGEPSAGYRTTPHQARRRLGIDVHPVQRPPGVKGFTIIPRRWTIERSIGRLMHHRRLTGEATLNWRGT